VNLMAATSTPKVPPPTLGDPLEIPAFLRRTREQQDAINEYNRAHPLPPTNFSGETQETRRAVDEARARMDAERAEEVKQQNASRAERRKLEAEQRKRGDFVSSEQVPGTQWDPGIGRWVKHNSMTMAKYNRLMEQMDTPESKRILHEMHGAGLGASPVDVSIRTQPGAGRKARDDQPSQRSGAGAKPAGRVRVTAAPPPKKAKPVGKGDAVAGVEAMLTRPEGATLAEIGAQYGWKEPSASAFISVNFRNLGRATTKEKVDGRGTVYRLEAKS
jgi:hypothetical protein